MYKDIYFILKKCFHIFIRCKNSITASKLLKCRNWHKLHFCEAKLWYVCHIYLSFVCHKTHTRTCMLHEKTSSAKLLALYMFISLSTSIWLFLLYNFFHIFTTCNKNILPASSWTLHNIDHNSSRFYNTSAYMFDFGFNI